MTDELNPYLERLVTEANLVEQSHGERFRAARAMITPGAAQENVFIRSSMVVTLLANGREAYARNAPADVQDALFREVALYRLTAQVLAGHGNAAKDVLPFWLWEEFQSQVGELGLELDTDE